MKKKAGVAPSLVQWLITYLTFLLSILLTRYFMALIINVLRSSLSLQALTITTTSYKVWHMVVCFTISGTRAYFIFAFKV